MGIRERIRHKARKNLTMEEKSIKSSNSARRSTGTGEAGKLGCVGLGQEARRGQTKGSFVVILQFTGPGRHESEGKGGGYWGGTGRAQ